MINACKECHELLLTDEVKGSNKDGGENNDYCSNCFRSGIFTHYKR
jgi:hypothetical protein